VSSIREISGNDIVIEVKPSFNAIVYACAAAVHDGMLTPTHDLPGQVVAILEFGLEMVHSAKLEFIIDWRKIRGDFCERQLLIYLNG
jgi:hypothetical protein